MSKIIEDAELDEALEEEVFPQPPELKTRLDIEEEQEAVQPSPSQLPPE